MLTSVHLTLATAIQPPALLPQWLDANYLLTSVGDWALWLGAAIIFAECGLLIGFFLPGDSLLFTVGLLTTAGIIQQPLWFACLLMTLMAFVGNISGYYIGKAAGPTIFRKNSRFFKPEYVRKTQEFFNKHGNRAIVLARFVPIVRTFITVMAGVGRMDPRRYFLYSGVGAVLWGAGLTLVGAAFGNVAVVKNNLEVIALLIVAVSVIPIGIEIWRDRRARTAAETADENTTAPIQESS